MIQDLKSAKWEPIFSFFLQVLCAREACLAVKGRACGILSPKRRADIPCICVQSHHYVSVELLLLLQDESWLRRTARKLPDNILLDLVYVFQGNSYELTNLGRSVLR